MSDLVPVKDLMEYLPAGMALIPVRNAMGAIVAPAGSELPEKTLAKGGIFFAMSDLRPEDRRRFHGDSGPVTAGDTGGTRLPSDKAAARRSLVDEVGAAAVKRTEELFDRVGRLNAAPDVAGAVAAAGELLASDADKTNRCVEVLRDADSYTWYHSLNVSLLFTESMRELTRVDTTIAAKRHIELDADMLERGVRGALLHDFGKVKVPQDILNKAGKLTDDEFLKMKQHTTLGVAGLKAGGLDDDLILGLVGNHHPAYLAIGTRQTPLQELLSMIDIWDACSSARCYKKEFTLADSLRILGINQKQYSWNQEIFSFFTGRMVPRFAVNKPKPAAP